MHVAHGTKWAVVLSMGMAMPMPMPMPMPVPMPMPMPIVAIALYLPSMSHSGALNRDIKPANVLIAASGHVKLADFGLSTSRSRRKCCGTLPYIAPVRQLDSNRTSASAGIERHPHISWD